MYNVYDWSNFSPEEILIYLRKSQSDDPNLTVEEVLSRHETILDEWSEKNLGVKIPEENRFREVVSGETIDGRPEILKLLKQIESPKFKAVLCVEPQRLSRGDLEDIGRLVRLVRYSNTLVITPQRAYDLRDEYDRDTFERELKRGNEYLEYTKKILDRGKLLSVSQGNYIGSVAPYGYDRTTIKDGKRNCPTLKINEYEANIVRMIFDDYVNNGMGTVLICNKLESMGVKSPQGGDKWSPTIITGILENIHYLGKVKWNWRKTIKTISGQELKETRPKAQVGEYLVYDGRHPAIISEELFNRAAEVRGSKPKTKNDVTLKNPLAGLMRCSVCGSAIGMNTYVRNGVEFAKPKIRCNNQKRCKSASADLEQVIEDIKVVLRKEIADYKERVESGQEDSLKLHQKLITQMEKQMKALEAKELEQWELRSAGEMPKPIFDKLNEKVLKEKEELRQALCTAYESMPKPVDYKAKEIAFSDALDALENPALPGIEKNKYLKRIINRIDYTRPPAVKMKKQKAIEVGSEYVSTGNGWYAPPYKLFIDIKDDLG